MDNQNTSYTHRVLAEKLVLILVLMDNQNTRELQYKYTKTYSLNPCSNG